MNIIAEFPQNTALNCTRTLTLKRLKAPSTRNNTNLRYNSSLRVFFRPLSRPFLSITKVSFRGNPTSFSSPSIFPLTKTCRDFHLELFAIPNYQQKIFNSASPSSTKRFGCVVLSSSFIPMTFPFFLRCHSLQESTRHRSTFPYS